MKKKRMRLSSFVSTILVLSGLMQTAVLRIHIEMIINLFSTIIGFYMFCFVLLTIINILNGSNFSPQKSKINIVVIYLITLLQILFGGLYIGVAINEVNTIAEVSMTSGMVQSFIFFGISMLASIIACVAATMFYNRDNEMDLYLG